MPAKPRAASQRSARKRHKFLEALADFGSVSKACAHSGLPRRTAYRFRDTEPGFAADWEKALDIGTDALEDEAVRRALEGDERAVYYGGKAVGTVRNYSDSLLMFMLRARRPERFRERVINEHTGEIDFTGARDELDRRLASVFAVADPDPVPSRPDGGAGKDPAP